MLISNETLQNHLDQVGWGRGVKNARGALIPADSYRLFMGEWISKGTEQILIDSIYLFFHTLFPHKQVRRASPDSSRDCAIPDFRNHSRIIRA